MQLMSQQNPLYRIEKVLQAIATPAIVISSREVLFVNQAARELLVLSPTESRDISHVLRFVRKLDEELFQLTDILDETITKVRKVMVVTPEKNPVIMKVRIVDLSSPERKEVQDAVDSTFQIEQLFLLVFEPEEKLEADALDLPPVNLVRTLNHEIKQPLTAFKAGLYVLKRRGNLAAELLKKVAELDEHINEMSRMLSNTVVAVRLSQGQRGAEPQKLLLSEVVEQAVEQIQQVFPTHRFSLTIATPMKIVADKNTVLQVLQQVLFNAARYSQAGSVITLASRKDSEFAVVSVTDPGVGMSVSTVSRATEPLFRGTEDQPLSYGMGLGLYIAHMNMTQLNGQLHITSQAGAGTEVSLFFPIA